MPDSILRVDMKTLSTRLDKLPDDYQYLAGRALSSQAGSADTAGSAR